MEFIDDFTGLFLDDSHWLCPFSGWMADPQPLDDTLFDFNALESMLGADPVVAEASARHLQAIAPVGNPESGDSPSEAGEDLCGSVQVSTAVCSDNISPTQVPVSVEKNRGRRYPDSPYAFKNEGGDWQCTTCSKKFRGRGRAIACWNAHLRNNTFICKGKCGNQSW